MHDVIVIGGGIGGFSAAIYAVRFQLKVLLIAEKKGGTIMESHRLENYPGFKVTSGVELMKNVEEQAKHLGAEIKTGRVEKAEKTGKTFKVSTAKETFEARAIIIATGTDRRKLDAEGEKQFLGKGVSYCATCDAPFFAGKDVAVIGGSDSAAWAAMLAAEHAKKVYIIYRKDKMRAEPINVKRLENNPKIEFIFNANVARFTGSGFLSGVELDTGKKIEVEGVFVEIGSVPASAVAVRLGVAVDQANYIRTDREQKTNVDGVYAVGDVTDTPMRQAITAAGQGAIAAKGCYEHIKNSK